MRPFHKLKPNLRSENFYNLIFVDTESYQNKGSEGRIIHTLRLGVAHYWRRASGKRKEYHEEIVFHHADDLWDFVESKVRRRSKIYLVAHNWNFDFLLTDAHQQLISREWTLKKWYNQGKTFMMTYRRHDSTLRLIDNMNLFPMSLSLLGSGIGHDKGRVDFSNVSDDELERYCRNDVAVMLEAWQSWLSFLRRYDLGNFAPTLASQAFNAWRHRFLDVDVYIHSNEEVIKLERAAYKGGRTEVFRWGEYDQGPYYKLDVNAMYPAVMRDNVYPSRLLTYSDSGSIAHLEHLLQSYNVIADVVVNVDEPVFPIRHHFRRMYPLGRFRTTLTTEELRYAITKGWVEEIFALAVYVASDLFSKWVNWIHTTERQAKANDDKVTAFQCKLLRNALYGKFGQRELVREVVGLATSVERDSEILYSAPTGERYETFNFLGYRWRETLGLVSYNAFPAIAAHVTANARLSLWRYVSLAGYENVYYVDTDSLIVNEEGYCRLETYVDNSELGYLKFEGVADSIAIYAPKDYTFGGLTFIKGISKNAVKLDDNTYQQWQWSGLSSASRHQYLDCVVVTPLVKRLQRKIETGEIAPDGRVKPYTMVYDGKTNAIANLAV